MDVMKAYLALKTSMKGESEKDPATAVIADELANKLMQIWKKASIPTVSKTRIVQKIRSYHNKWRNLQKPYQKRKNTKSYIEKIEKFKEASTVLFDVAACKIMCLYFMQL